jgi:hypothetical protein
MKPSRRLVLLLACALARPAFAASADPSLMPGFDALRGKPRPAETPVEAKKEAEPPPAAVPLGAPPPRPAWKDESEAPRRPWFLLRERNWFLHGNVDRSYATIATGYTASGGETVWTGTGENARLRGIMPIAEAEFAPLTWLSLEGEYGAAGVSAPGMGRVAWVNAPGADLVTNPGTGAHWANPNHAEDFSAAFDGGSAVTSWAEANLCLRLIDSSGGTEGRMEYDHYLDLLVGAERFRDRFTVLNRHADLNTGAQSGLPAQGSTLAGPAFDLNSIWQGPHVGLRAQTALPQGFHFDATALWSPFMEYRGDLNDYEGLGVTTRSQFPNITERARGTAVHFRLAGAWVWENFSLEGGWIRLYFTSRTGVRRTYAPNGTSSDAQLDHAVTERSGLYAGASWRF